MVVIELDPLDPEESVENPGWIHSVTTTVRAATNPADEDYTKIKFIIRIS